MEFTELNDNIKADYPVRVNASEEKVVDETNRIAKFCKQNNVKPHHYIFLLGILEDKDKVEEMCQDSYEYDIPLLEYYRLYSSIKSSMVDSYRGMGKNNYKDLIYLIDKK